MDRGVDIVVVGIRCDGWLSSSTKGIIWLGLVRKMKE